MRAKYTPEEDQRILDMRSDGKGFPEISAEMKRSEKSVSQRYYYLKNKPKISVYKANHYKRKAKSLTVETAPEAPITKPMVAIVGSVDEVTRTLRGLFS